MSRRWGRVTWWRRLFMGRAVMAAPGELVALPNHGYERAGLDVAHFRTVLERKVKQLAEVGGVDEGTGDAFDALIETWSRQAVEQVRLHHAHREGFAQTLLVARRSSWAAARSAAEQAKEAHHDARAALQRAETRADALAAAPLVPPQRQPDAGSERSAENGFAPRSQTS